MRKIREKSVTLWGMKLTNPFIVLPRSELSYWSQQLSTFIAVAGGGGAGRAHTTTPPHRHSSATTMERWSLVGVGTLSTRHHNTAPPWWCHY